MAYTAVVTTAFTEKMIAALKQLEKERGPLALAVMTPFELLGEQRWSLYLAAEWLDRMDLRDAIKLMGAFFKQRLGNDASLFQQAFILRATDSRVFTFERKLAVSELGTAYRVIGLDLDDFVNDDAILFLSRHLSQPQTQRHQVITA